MEDNNNEENIGIVKISDEVVSVIAGISAAEIPGIIEHVQGVTNNITSILKGKKAAGKAVKVTLNEDRAVIDMTLDVEYGIKIKEVVAKVQENVKKTVEAMTGLIVDKVNITIQDIYLSKTEKDEEA